MYTHQKRANDFFNNMTDEQFESDPRWEELQFKVDDTFQAVTYGKIVITSYSIHYTKLYEEREDHRTERIPDVDVARQKVSGQVGSGDVAHAEARVDPVEKCREDLHASPSPTMSLSPVTVTGMVSRGRGGGPARTFLV